MAAGIYLHIPFCRAKCAYCDFASFAGLESLTDDYLWALQTEISRAASLWQQVTFTSLFIGGGTPTLLSPDQIGPLLDSLRAHFALDTVAEITIEANPGTVDMASLRALRGLGINRLSLGVQSMNDGELALLGRIHRRAEAIAAVACARAAGWTNINLDLMLGLPGQHLAQWAFTLAQAVELAPEHLSVYALTIEEDTPLAQAVAAGALPEPIDDEVATLYEHTEQVLAQAGYTHYEISNWARTSAGDAPDAPPALACQHNLLYWRNERYVGLGSAAHSYDGVTRSGNVRSPAEYIARLRRGEAPVAESEALTRAQSMGETAMLGLRLIAGLERDRLRQRYGVELEDEFGVEIATLAADGLLTYDARGIRLTPRGRLLGNRVFAAFLR